MSDSSLERAPRTRRRTGWGLILGLVVLGLKVQAFHVLLHHLHGAEAMALLGAALAGSILRAKPLLMAAFAGALVALAVDPASTPVGIGLGVGAAAVALAAVVGFALALEARRGR